MGALAIVLPLGKCPHYAKYFHLIGTILHSASFSFQLAKATGCKPLAKSYSRMAPTAASLVLVVTPNCFSKSGSFKTGAVVNANFSPLNIWCCDVDHGELATGRD